MQYSFYTDPERANEYGLSRTFFAALNKQLIVAGAFFGGCLEAFGRIHGWPIEWFGADVASMEMSGVVYDPIYYSNLIPMNGVIIVVGIFSMFILAGLLPAIRAARLHPIEAMRQK